MKKIFLFLSLIVSTNTIAVSGDGVGVLKSDKSAASNSSAEFPQE